MSGAEQDAVVEEEILKIEEAARLLRVNPETVRRLSEAGKLKAAFKVGRMWRYRRAELIGEAKSK